MKHETLILGSSPYALGYALTHENCRIFENGFLADPVFAGTLEGFSVKKDNEYAAIFRRHGDEKNGKRDLLRSEVLLAEWILEQKTSFAFATQALKTERRAEAYRVTCLDNEGLHAEDFGKVIDAREDKRGEIFRVLCKGGMPEFLPSTDGIEMKAEAAFAENTFLLSFLLPRSMTPDEAKCVALPLAKQFFEGRAVWLMSAHRMAGKESFAPYTDGDGIIHVSPRFFGSPEEAFDAGREAEV